MSTDQFTQLPRHMKQRFDAVDKCFKAHDVKNAGAIGSIAALTPQLPNYHYETISLGCQANILWEVIRQPVRNPAESLQSLGR